jgi:HEPN domain-containing protein
MKKLDIQKIVNYWKTMAERDHETMLGLFKIKRYPESLFFGHIVLEKILKALVVKETKKQAPYTHNLIELQEISGIRLSENAIDLLNEISDFNIRARYPGYKLEFIKKSSKDYTENYLKRITKLYKELCRKLARKK